MDRESERFIPEQIEVGPVREIRSHDTISNKMSNTYCAIKSWHRMTFIKLAALI